MARPMQYVNFEQGEGENANVVCVRVKTTTKRYLDKLIKDYRNSGDLDNRAVKIVPVKPLFS